MFTRGGATAQMLVTINYSYRVNAATGDVACPCDYHVACPCDYRFNAATGDVACRVTLL